MREAAHREAFVGPVAARGQVLAFPDAFGTRRAGGLAVDDATLVQMLLDGDPRAPRAAWQRLAPMVHRMLRRAFGPSHDVADLVQEVFLLLFARVGTMREPQALRAFVITLTAHAIRRELRRMRVARWLTFGQAPDPADGGADFASREAVRRLYAVLDRLGPDDRTAFTLRYFEGLEVAEVAEAVGVSLATVKRRLARAHGRVVFHAQRDAALAGYLATLGGGAES